MEQDDDSLTGEQAGPTPGDKLLSTSLEDEQSNNTNADDGAIQLVEEEGNVDGNEEEEEEEEGGEEEEEEVSGLETGYIVENEDEDNDQGLRDNLEMPIGGDEDDENNSKSPDVPVDDLGEYQLAERNSFVNSEQQQRDDDDSGGGGNVNRDTCSEFLDNNENSDDSDTAERIEEDSAPNDKIITPNEVGQILFDGSNSSSKVSDNVLTNNEDSNANEGDVDEVEEVLEETHSETEKRNGGVGTTQKNLDKLESEEEDTDVPMIRVKSAGLFAEEEEDDDEEQDAEGGRNNSASTPTRPRRAAATAAADVIRETISTLEAGEDAEDRADAAGTSVERTSYGHRCHVCKKVAIPKVTVQQYGQDLNFCTSVCFSIFRNPNAPPRKYLPCVKCGIIQRDSVPASCYYWETMNFCSDLCVGSYQMEIGAKCATCSKKVAWLSLGKYCVRFGSDVRQFCTATCLEAYKKNARVCFHCQLDIKKLSNVILANVPAKTTPKEFCSQDCVEMYIEQNLHQTVRHKPNQNSVCVVCSAVKVTFRELVLTVGNFKVCSEVCWTKLLEMKNVRRPVKCEICSKYVELTFCSDPKLYVSTQHKVVGFCSPTCKNVYVLRSRQILACTSCKVKKYNYDLIQHIDEVGATTFAVCSLNCIPKPSMYIINLRETLTPAATASEMLTKSRALAQEAQQQQVGLTTLGRIRTTIIPVDGSSSGGDSGTANNSTDSTRRDIRFVSSSSLSSNVVSHIDLSNISMAQMDMDVELNGDDVVRKVVSDEEMDEYLMSIRECLVYPPKEPILPKNVGCMAKPSVKSAQVQTTTESCSEACRGTCQVKEKYVPILVPIFVPFPFYALESPVPIPLPVPIPVPIPIPLVMPTEPRGRLAMSSVPNPSPFDNNGLQSNQSPLQSAAVITTSTSISEPMAIDPVSRFLDLAEPNVGESDSFDILNTIPNLDMELGLEPGHHSPSVSQMMNDTSLIPGSSCSMMGSVIQDPTVSMHWRPPVPQQTVLRAVSSVPSHPGIGRDMFALRVWQEFFGTEADPVLLTDQMLCEKLKELVQKGQHDHGERFQPSFLLYLCLGLQQYLRSNQRSTKIFYHSAYESFVQAFVSYCEYSYQGGSVGAVIDESHFWESYELGVNSPEALMFTLVYYNYKYFNLRMWQDHESLTFNHFVVGTKLGPNNQRYKYLTLVGPFSSATSVQVDEMEPQNKCFVKLFEFYKYKCLNSTGPFYKAFIPQPPSKGKWYGSEPLSQMEIYRMIVRAMMIKS